MPVERERLGLDEPILKPREWCIAIMLSVSLIAAGFVLGLVAQALMTHCECMKSGEPIQTAMVSVGVTSDTGLRYDFDSGSCMCADLVIDDQVEGMQCTCIGTQVNEVFTFVGTKEAYLFYRGMCDKRVASLSSTHEETRR